jgi:hypothetical protein
VRRTILSLRGAARSDFNLMGQTGTGPLDFGMLVEGAGVEDASVPAVSLRSGRADDCAGRNAAGVALEQLGCDGERAHTREPMYMPPAIDPACLADGLGR